MIVRGKAAQQLHGLGALAGDVFLCGFAGLRRQRPNCERGRRDSALKVMSWQGQSNGRPGFVYAMQHRHVPHHQQSLLA